jgi:hypothetical protein
MGDQNPVSKVPCPVGDKDVTDKAHSMFKRLTDQGYESRQIVSVAARLVGLVTEKIATTKS